MVKDNKGKNGASTQAGAPGSGGGLGVWGLAGVVVSSMIGGGIYSLPQNMAAGASAGAVLLAWLITGIGVYFLANTFRILSEVKPDLSAGIYMYSREGFGPYAGFTIGWSYWLCQVCGNVGYAVIAMDALNYFFCLSGDLTRWCCAVFNRRRLLTLSERWRKSCRCCFLSWWR